MVPGATRRWARILAGSRRIKAARTARSAQSKRGLGLVRRSTATSCRNTSSSTSLVEAVRPSSKTSPRTCWKIRYSSRSDTAAIMPGHRRRPPITAAQPHVPRSGTPQGPGRGRARRHHRAARDRAGRADHRRRLQRCRRWAGHSSGAPRGNLGMAPRGAQEQAMAAAVDVVHVVNGQSQTPSTSSLRTRARARRPTIATASAHRWSAAATSDGCPGRCWTKWTCTPGCTRSRRRCTLPGVPCRYRWRRVGHRWSVWSMHAHTRRPGGAGAATPAARSRRLKLTSRARATRRDAGVRGRGSYRRRGRGRPTSRPAVRRTPAPPDRQQGT